MTGTDNNQRFKDPLDIGELQETGVVVEKTLECGVGEGKPLGLGGE